VVSFIFFIRGFFENEKQYAELGRSILYSPGPNEFLLILEGEKIVSRVFFLPNE
jgi:hypothetical protein